MTMVREPLLTALEQAHSTCLAADEISQLDRERVHEDAFMRVATAVEHFLTDWFVRALADDVTHLTRNLQRELADDAAARYVPTVRIDGAPERVMNAISVLQPAVTIEIDAPDHLRLTDARSVLGVEDTAMSMRSLDDYRRLATQLLSPARRKNLMALPRAQAALLNTTIKLRHVIAHRSAHAANELNTSLGKADLHSALRRNTVKGGRVTAARVGRYLATPAQGWMRQCWLVEGLGDIAYSLATSAGRPRTICACPLR